MKAFKHDRKTSLARVLALGLLLGLAGATTSCSGSTARAAGKPVVGEGEIAPPTKADIDELIELSSQRAQLVCKGDWIQVYDFYGQSYKEFTTLYTFLEGKSTHHYKDPSKPLWVGYKDGQGYLEADMFWQSTHPQIIDAGGMGWDLLEMVEVWEWNGKEWGYRENERRSEFYQRNPDLLK